MAASQLSLYNGALRIIKNRRLSTITDDVEERYLLDDVYEEALGWCLEQGLWNFALRAVLLEASTDVVPEFGWVYAFEKPSDFVRLNAIGGNEYMDPTLEQYVDEGGYWLADVNPLYVSFISNNSSYGGDTSKWPRTYELFVQHELAWRVAPHLTAMPTEQLGQLQDLRDRAMKDARSKDALNQPAMRPPPGRLVQSRLGSRTYTGRPWWR
jgi:hypothetical protein